MIEQWMRFCVRKGANFEIANRGVDIMMEMEPDGTRPNIDYYRQHGWAALRSAAEKSLGNQMVRQTS